MTELNFADRLIREYACNDINRKHANFTHNKQNVVVKFLEYRTFFTLKSVEYIMGIYNLTSV